MPEVVTAGETMILGVPSLPGRLRHATGLELKIGGAESNVAIALSRLGVSAGWVGYSEDLALVEGEPASPLHLAFVAPDPEAVDAFHAAALASGGRDNGPPGLRERYNPHYYAAFVIDPDGHNVEALFQGP
jgi:catechol 2,3-dioxygenase-like lactoylglutathione lyase family enzyme